MVIKAKSRGSLLGVAVGDALGATLEFMTKDEIKREYGVLRDITGGGCWELAPGEVTDDTDMTMAAARGIINSFHEPLESIAREFKEWIRTQPRDAGKISRLVLEEGLRSGAETTEEWFRISEYFHYQTNSRSAGNGSLMRTIPVVIAYYQNRAKMLSLAKQQSKLTHFSELAGECTAFYCDVVRQILLGAELKETLKLSLSQAPITIDLQSPVEYLPTTGYVAHTLAASFACAFQTSSFEDSIVMAVNLGGDADTMGAVTGGLTGAYYGIENIPQRWLAKLKIKADLLDLADQLLELN